MFGEGKPQTGFFSFKVRAWGILTAAGLLAALATIAGFLGRFSWFLDLFSHFRLQYALGLLLLSGMFALGRRRCWAIVFLVFALINALQLAPLFIPSSKSIVDPATSHRMMVLNVNTGGGDPVRVKDAINATDPDWVLLMEVSQNWVKSLGELSARYPYSILEPREDNFGIALYSRYPLAGARIVEIGEAGVPSIAASVQTPEGPIHVLGMHPLPPTNADYSRLRNDHLEQLKNFVPKDVPVLVAGDFNVTPWNFHFRRMLEQTSLTDSARGHGIQGTWPDLPYPFRIPIDHCLHTNDIAILDRKIGPNVASDHYPLIVDLAILPEAQQDSSLPPIGTQ